MANPCMLTKDDRAAINQRANELSRRTWEIYRERLSVLAVRQKLDHGRIPAGFVEAAEPDIRDALEPGEGAPF